MSLLPVTFFPRSLFDMDQWSLNSRLLTPSTFDLFDPYDELDNLVSRNLQWLNKPDFISNFPMIPRVPQKYRITVECPGFSPSSIRTQVQGSSLIVTGSEESRNTLTDDFTVREFKRTFQLPANAVPDKLVSFMTTGDRLVIEVPLRETNMSPNSLMFPQIVDNLDGTKSVSMRFPLPEYVDPNKINVSVKDRDLILRAEDVQQTPDKYSSFYFYKRATLPENTDLNNLKCVFDGNQVLVTAPLSLDFTRTYKNVPIQNVQPTRSQIQQQTTPQLYF
jgi:HSP20 family molecular chaperone IbpA